MTQIHFCGLPTESIQLSQLLSTVALGIQKRRDDDECLVLIPQRLKVLAAVVETQDAECGIYENWGSIRSKFEQVTRYAG